MSLAHVLGGAWGAVADQDVAFTMGYNRGQRRHGPWWHGRCHTPPRYPRCGAPPPQSVLMCEEPAGARRRGARCTMSDAADATWTPVQRAQPVGRIRAAPGVGWRRAVAINGACGAWSAWSSGLNGMRSVRHV